MIALAQQKKKLRLRKVSRAAELAWKPNVDFHTTQEISL